MNSSYSQDDLIDEKTSLPANYHKPAKTKAPSDDCLTWPEPTTQTKTANPVRRNLRSLEQEEGEEKSLNDEEHSISVEEREALNKEVLEARKKLVQERLETITPCWLRTMLRLMQEDACSLKTPGFTCSQHPEVLMLPTIEANSNTQIVLKCNHRGCLNKSIIKISDPIVKEIVAYHFANHEC